VKAWIGGVLIEVRLARREGRLDRFLNLMDWWNWEWECWCGLRRGRSLGQRDLVLDGRPLHICQGCPDLEELRLLLAS
jgi:hypothetical protein